MTIPASRHYQILPLGAAVIVASFFLILGPSPRNSPEFSVSRVKDIHEYYWRVVDANEGGIVILQITNRSRSSLYLGKEQVQMRVRGLWQKPVDCDWLCNSRSFCFVEADSHKEFMAAYVPREVEAIRLRVTYRYTSWLDYSFCSLCGYLSSLGYPKSAVSIIDQATSKLDSGVREPLNRLRPWRHVIVNFALPSRAHTQAQTACGNQNEHVPGEIWLVETDNGFLPRKFPSSVSRRTKRVD